MDITALHLQFEKLGWEGVTSFAEVVRQMRCGGMSMDFMRRTYATDMEDFGGANEHYTVENYLSDLLLRKGRLTDDNIKWVNHNFGQLADHIQSTRQAQAGQA